MKKILVVTLASAFTQIALAKEANKEDTKSYDFEKFCYYEDAEYSHGALIKQADSLMVCVRSVSSKSLVWRKYKTPSYNK